MWAENEVCEFSVVSFQLSVLSFQFSVKEKIVILSEGERPNRRTPGTA